MFFDVLRQGLLVAAGMALPLLATALVLGLIVGLFPALTSIQEMSLTFVPKLAGALAVLWFTLGFMTQSIVTFFTGTLIPLIQGAV